MHDTSCFIVFYDRRVIDTPYFRLGGLTENPFLFAAKAYHWLHANQSTYLCYTIKNKMREFIPGPCAYQPDVIPAFEAIQSGQSDMAAESLARAACGGCIQREFCGDQRQEIATELAKQNAVDQVMLAGEIIDMQQANEAVAMLSDFERLRDPMLTFDIAHLPDTAMPTQRLDFVRQALRTRQISMKGSAPPFLKEYTTIAADRKRHTGIEGETHSQIVSMSAKLAMRSRAFGLNRRQKILPLSPEELTAAHELFDVLYDDAAGMAAAKLPFRFAAYHRPAHYTAILKNFPPGRITKSEVASFLRDYSADPISAISRYLDSRRGITQRTAFAGGYSVNAKKVSRGHTNPERRIREVVDIVKDLRRKYVAENPKTISHFAANFADPEGAMEAYIAARTELQTDKRFSDLTPKQLDRIAREEPYAAASTALALVERLATIHSVASAEAMPVSRVAALNLARTSRPITPDTIQQFIHQEQGKRLYGSLDRPIKMWLATRIVEVVPEAHQKSTGNLVCNLTSRGILEYKMAESGKDLKTLVWADGANYLTDREKAAILCVTGIDSVMGLTYDQVELQTSLGTNHLPDLVNHVLVPGLFPVDRRNILATIRYRKQNAFWVTSNTFDACDESLREAIFARAHHEIKDKKLAQLAAKSFIVSLAAAYPDGRYYPGRAKIALETVINEALLPYLAQWRLSSSAEKARSFLSKDPEWDHATIAYVGDLSDLHGRVEALAAVRANPLAFIRRYRRHDAYLRSRDDLQMLSASDRHALICAGSAEEVAARADSLIEMLARHRKNIWAPPSVIKYVCLNSPRKDPEVEIQNIVSIARTLYGRYGDRIGKTECIYLAFSRAEALQFAASAVRKMDEILARYRRTVYMTDRVAYRIAIHQSNSAEDEVAAYSRRYDLAKKTLDDEEASGPDEVIAWLAITNRTAGYVESAVRAYVKQSRFYSNIPEFEQWMVDKAFLQPNNTQALLSLIRMRRKLKYSPSLDQPLGQERSYGDVVATSGRSIEDDYIDNTEQPDDSNNQQKRTLIMSTLNELDTLSRAAVLTAFDLKDLMSDDMVQADLDDTAYLCGQLGIAESGLELYVRTQILSRLSNQQ